jgi:hypothetical protein
MLSALAKYVINRLIHGLFHIALAHVKRGRVLCCLNATFNNISVISWLSVLLVEETRVLRENHRSAVLLAH